MKRCDNNERLGAVCCHKLRSSDAKAEFELKNKLYAWVETAPAQGKKKAQKRKDRCVPYDLRHAYAIRARETTTWNYADVAAVMGHSPEVHRRTYLSEVTSDQIKASVKRRMLGPSMQHSAMEADLAAAVVTAANGLPVGKAVQWDSTYR